MSKYIEIVVGLIGSGTTEKDPPSTCGISSQCGHKRSPHPSRGPPHQGGDAGAHDVGVRCQAGEVRHAAHTRVNPRKHAAHTTHRYVHISIAEHISRARARRRRGSSSSAAVGSANCRGREWRGRPRSRRITAQSASDHVDGRRDGRSEMLAFDGTHSNHASTCSTASRRCSEFEHAAMSGSFA